MALILEDLLRPDVQGFIQDHADDDEKALVLKYSSILGIPASLIADQIAGRRKAKDKLPLYYRTKGIIYPSLLNLEQCSSEITAGIKLSLLQSMLNSKAFGHCADITGGLGVDSFFLSQACDSFDYVEPSGPLLEIARHNHLCLGATSIHYNATTAEKFLSLTNKKFDFIFLDPSRRKNNMKVFRLAECEPNPIAMLPELLQKTDLVALKASPLFDLLQGCKDLSNVERIAVIAVGNECKEVLFFCMKNYVAEPVITCINTTRNGDMDQFDFSFSAERKATSVFSEPQRYLYEPNAAILKGGAFKSIGERFEISKIQQHTHLYTSETLISDFPGRIFSIEKINPETNHLKIYLPDGKANIITRNYPLTPEQIKKKLKLKDGGEKFLIGFSGIRTRYLVVADRIKKPGDSSSIEH
jgi:16S rRNA G966 N2-methylase RsmD